ncbi:conserved exported hypothetical protein [Luteimonas sp. 9C]|uniref:hypothetical protein n=1 Tax=Luteimonas sp. 9C TaxID=2653148 RepID=UPI0012F17985|nr:hypothetical protein [Luteimonas sp. 9C]VXB61665.1 conserved exported hypothetical protein [Luteimonas sp. 9C]
MNAAAVTAFALALCLPMAAWPAPPESGGVREEIRRDLEDARRDIRTDLARARAELETDNLDVTHSLQANGDARRDRKAKTAPALPKAEITPRGDFLIDGEAVAIDSAQRRQLLAYRGMVIEVAKAGIDIGEVSALAAVDSVDRGVFSLMVGAMTGSLERRIERTVRDTVGPGVMLICDRMPALREAQQQLASDLPAFRPYARLEAQDADSCRNEVRREFAGR